MVIVFNLPMKTTFNISIP